MKAIFDRHCNLVGWYDSDTKNIFDENMEWIAFLINGFVYNIQCGWIGAYVEGTFVDHFGKPVAWIDGSTPKGCGMLLQPLRPLLPLRPLRPLRPLTPLRPLRPLDPLGGWSSLEWERYVSGSGI